MRFTPVSIERLMRNGYIRNTHDTPVRYVNAGLVWLRHRKEAE